MKIKEGFILKNVAGSNIVIATGEEKISFKGVMTFNEVGAEVFTLLNGENSVESIVEKLSAEYDAPKEQIEADVKALIEKMREYGLIED